MGDSIVRHTEEYRALNNGDNVGCLLSRGNKYRLSQRGWNKSWARVKQIILSGILSVMGTRGQGFRNCRRLAINKLVIHVGKRKLDLCGCFVGRADM